MRQIIFISFLLLSQLGFSQLLINDTSKAIIEKTFQFRGIQVKKVNEELIDRTVLSSIKIRTYGTISDTLTTQLVEQIDIVELQSSLDVYNFLLNWIPFDCIDESPLQDLPLLDLRGSRKFLKAEEKRLPFLNGTQQIFTTGPLRFVIIFSSIDIVIVKRDGSYIVFYNE